MPKLLRKIKKNRWYEGAEAPGEPSPDTLLADPLADLNTIGNALSVWLVEDDEASVRRLLTALAANCHGVGKIDATLFDPAELERFGITVEKAPGHLPDKSLNDWHRNLANLTAAKVVNLACLIMSRRQWVRETERAMESLIAQALKDGWIDRESLPKEMVADLVDRAILK